SNNPPTPLVDNEPVEVSPAQPTLTTTASGDTQLGTGATTITDTPDLEGAYNPTGSILFTLTLDAKTVAAATQTATPAPTHTYACPRHIPHRYYQHAHRTTHRRAPSAIESK